jgi:hypothetical protein
MLACRARGRGQFADDLGEDLAALFVLRALAVHDVFELRMAGHLRGSRVTTKGLI